MSTSTKTWPSATVRQSQMVMTVGPGAMVDLARHSVIIGGLESWYGDMKDIQEERLAGRVARLLGQPSVKLFAPPVDSPDPAAPRTGVRSYIFPTWFLAQVDRTWKVMDRVYRTRPLVPWSALVKGRYLDDDKKSRPIVPVRFVQACVNGHISDIDWVAFVHETFESKCRGPLWMDEGGTGGDLAEVFVRCATCGKRRVLANAKLPGKKVLGPCMGHRPWLGPRASEPCVSRTTDGAEPNRLLTRSASNAWFSQVLSVISIPDHDDALRKAVDPIWEDELQYVEDLDELRRLRGKNKPKITSQLEGWSNDEVWGEIMRRRNPGPGPGKLIKQAEIETLLSQKLEETEDVPECDFFARARPLDNLPSWLMRRLERIVLVHRLREVQAIVGFTRFEPALPDVDGELGLNVQRATLARDMTWVPAIENRGEGVFLAFRKDAVDAWRAREPVQERERQIADGFKAWCRAKGMEGAIFPGAPYVMLHSFAHLLLTAVSLDCGYSATSIRERVYAGPGGYGVLLYTGTPGSEGTLGGLVQVGRSLEGHIEKALEMGRLCSNDPVCAQHTPSNPLEERFLHGAACHGCLLLAETSCERRNEFLDRALVVATVEGLGAEFFDDV